MTDREFRLAYVPGVTPAKWVNIWAERVPDVPLTLISVAAADAVRSLHDGTADAAFVRLPVDREGLSAIPLYIETTVVVVPKEHAVTAADEVTVADLADEEVFHPLDDTLGWTAPPGLPAFTRPGTTAEAIELVAVGSGLLLVPLSLARLYHRKDLTYRPVVETPQSQIALAWPTEATTDLVEDFIGIVRGRTVNSSRGRTPAPPTEKTRKQPRKPTPNGSARRGTQSTRGRRGHRPR
ncbi:LysR family substrate-binding domain-containing protein [Spongiactinospora sp. TRM90649]|uniref:LysR family substrate-binding domain-containing protein n=1 Tax=Spongiactinospora sp. TRM90649 TaxID=3031114 RepID=UPI0023F87FDB|nr:LysR family substrate-binding domain-containing protein [Spongiactinospora sp. TRM90649]MDF5752934.1 LysR family substrate-binding domain-containing protein [Spongiactinospora sp. TRM90649]